MTNAVWEPYRYYPPNDGRPELCEISPDDFVFLFRDESIKPRDSYRGRFVRLVEAEEEESETAL